MEPFRIIGNVYFVGTFQASCHLIDTGEGLILIDPGYSNALYLVVGAIYELGFNPKDVKYIINTHWHGDHTEATAAMMDLSGANTLAQGHFDYDGCREDYRDSLRRLQKEKVDVFIGNHVWNNDTAVKGELLLKTGENKFIDGNLWHEFLIYCEKRLDEVISKDT